MEEDIKILEKLSKTEYYGDEIFKKESQAIENILIERQADKERIKELEEENEELMKLKENQDYSVDVIRENTKLRYDLFNSIPKAKVEEEIGARKYIMEEYKKKWAHKDEKYYRAEIEFNLLQKLLKDGGE